MKKATVEMLFWSYELYNELFLFLRTLIFLTRILLLNRDPVLIKKIGEATALEVRATGIQYAFAPCIAVRTKLHSRLLLFRSYKVSIE